MSKNNDNSYNNVNEMAERHGIKRERLVVNPDTGEVAINGVVYKSLAEAAKAYNISREAVVRRMR